MPERAAVLSALSCVATVRPTVGVPGGPRRDAGLGENQGVEVRLRCSIGGSAAAAPSVHMCAWNVYVCACVCVCARQRCSREQE
eukprot:1159982-Pelagomonas_calceolata.AAC.3